MTSVPKLFGSEVFNETVMKDRLPTATYKAFKNAVLKGEPLDLPIANIIANAMKDWALEHGATHFTHWFQPMTGITAEKHESFITPTADGRVIMDFRARSWYRASLMLRAFLPAGSVLLLKRAATLPGTRQAMLLLKTAACIFRRRFALTRAMCLTRKLRFCAACAV